MSARATSFPEIFLDYFWNPTLISFYLIRGYQICVKKQLPLILSRNCRYLTIIPRSVGG